MVLEQYQKEAAGGAPKEERSLKSILADSKDGALFGRLLQSLGRDDLNEALVRGNLDAQQLQDLDGVRAEFLDRKEQAKTVSERIDKNHVNELIGQSPELQQIASLTGVDSLVDMLKRRAEDIAMNDPSAFDVVRSNLNDLRVYRESSTYKDLDKEVSKLCKDAKIDERSFAQIMQNPDDASRAAELRDEIRKDYTMFRKSLDWVKSSGYLGMKDSRKWAEELAAQKAELDRVTGEVNVHIQGIGNALAGTLTDNPAVNAAFTQELLGDKPKETSKETPLKDVRNKMSSTKSLEDAWLQGGRPANFDTLNARDQDRARDEHITRWKTQQENTLQRTPGIWAQILLGLVTAFTSGFNKANLR